MKAGSDVLMQRNIAKNKMVTEFEKEVAELNEIKEKRHKLVELVFADNQTSLNDDNSFSLSTDSDFEIEKL